jgi:sigma-B regulation protein RsbU (phosphoserine phosphatase)
VEHVPPKGYSARLVTARNNPARLLDDLQVILDVSRSLGAERDLPRLLTIIVEAVTRLVGADRTSLFLVDQDRNELWTPVAQGTGGSTIRLPVGKGIAGTVAATGETISIPEAYADPRFNRANDQRTGYQTRSILCMPLRNHAGVVVGVLQTLNKRDGKPFSAYDEQVLGSLCAQAAVAVDNAQLVQRDLERQRLMRDMELAREIQLSLLPPCPEPMQGWRFAAYSRSCDETGGDYYDFLTHPNAIDLVVGDVSGHGIGAALFMGTARAFLRALHHGTGRDLPTGEAMLARLNDLLVDDMGDDRFMTMGIARLRPDGACSLISAGHDMPIVWRRGRGCEQSGDTGLILGMLGDQSYVEHAIAPLAPGDILVSCTDGITEAQKPSDHALFGRDRLMEVIAEAADAGGGAAGVSAAVIAAVESHLAAASPHDDITLVVSERLGTP